MIIGIDLGTTNSLCAVFRDGQPALIPNVHESYLTPSVVGIQEDGQIIIGAVAREYRVTHPERCASRFKRWMGTDRKITIADKTFTAPELSSLILRNLKSDAELFLGNVVEEAVITVPAYFNDTQRKATKLAGQMAGLNVRRIINEPTAAALSYGFHEPDSEKYLLVIDLGGGTFDVTLMEVFEGSLEIVSTAGENFLGGEDFTDRVVNAVLKQQGKQLESAELKTPLLVARLRQTCEIAKRELATNEIAYVPLPGDDGEITESSKRVKVDGKTIGKLSRSLLDRLAAPIHKCMRDGGRGPEEIDEVIFVGGATRMPWLNDYLVEELQLNPQCRFNRDEVVALGASIQAALIVDDQAVEDLVMTDVCPYTLGVEVVKSFGSRMQDGYFQPVIHRNTTVPVSKEETFSTVMENQSEVLLKVYQGESRKVEQNHLLGELRVTGIPPGPAGRPFTVRFTYDINGILEVEALIDATGEKFNTVLTNHAGDMTEAEIAKAIVAMQQLKFYPRDEERNRRLVLFCETSIGEINPVHRPRLEEALDMFEHSMQTATPEEFEAARESLLHTLSALGLSYDSD